MEMKDSTTETENASSSVPKLPLPPLLKMAPLIHYSGGSGMRTPPHHTLASIPFQWEEEPGKPRPCTTLIPFHPNTNNINIDLPRCLELPPRLLSQKIKTSSSSPVTVLDGPYYVGRSKFISSSFRLIRERQGSFDSSGGDEEEREDVGYEDEGRNLQKRRGFFGLRYWKRNKYSSNLLERGGRKEVGSRSFGYESSSMDKTNFWRSEENDGSCNRISNVTKNGSFANGLSKATTHFWAAMYEGIKQVIPWKSKKSK